MPAVLSRVMVFRCFDFCSDFVSCAFCCPMRDSAWATRFCGCVESFMPLTTGEFCGFKFCWNNDGPKFDPLN